MKTIILDSAGKLAGLMFGLPLYSVGILNIKNY